MCWQNTSHPTEQKISHCINVHPCTYIYTFKHLTEMLYTWLSYRSRQACGKGARWSSGINAANGASKKNYSKNYFCCCCSTRFCVLRNNEMLTKHPKLFTLGLNLMLASVLAQITFTTNAK